MSEEEDITAAVEQFRKLKQFIQPTIKQNNSFPTNANINHAAITSSSTMKSSQNIGEIMAVQSQMAALRLNQQTQTENDCTNYCRNCCIVTAPETKRSITPVNDTRGISNDQLKEWAFQQPLMEMRAPCNSTCTVADNHKKCFQLCSIENIIALRSNFWGLKEGSTLSRIERNRKINAALTTAWNKQTRIFTYAIENRVVCENAYFRAIGYLTETSRLPKKFYEMKNEIMTPGITMQKKNVAINYEAENAPKRNHAIRYLRQMAEFYGEHGYGETVADVKFVPFDTMQEIYLEYRAKTEREDSPIFPAEILLAGREVFRQAFMSVQHEMRLRSSKGAFETCSVCNAFHEILKSESSRWSVDKIDLVMKFKRLHLKLQAEEREDSERRKLLAKDSFDAEGNPMYAYFEADGYTKFKCLTPRNHMYRKVKGDSKHVGNNVIGIIVICGPIRTRFVYSMDDLVENGANMMIEVMRQAFHDLGILLADFEGKSYNMPKTAFLQFDNCGVNKNQFMFTYLSLLVERGHFDEIRVNFLIVGHTHTSIDQYFSVITKMLHKKFVGSPLSLQHLFNACQSPLINKMIHVQYDYKTWLTPVINQRLHHYGLPHVFIFKRRIGRAVCQHKPYSRSPRLFPVEPDHLPKQNDELVQLSRQLVVEPLSFIGGIESIQEALNINENINSRLLSTQSDLFDRFALLNNLIQPLKDIDCRVSCEISNKMDLQADVGYVTTLTADSLMNRIMPVTDVNVNEVVADSDSDDEEVVSSTHRNNNESKSNEDGLVVDDPTVVPKAVTKDQLTMFSKALAELNYNECGYLLWLDYDKVNEEWLNSAPSMFNYSTDLSLLCRLKLTAEATTNKLTKSSIQRYAGLENAINKITSTSTSIIKDLRGGFYRTHEATSSVPYCYTEKKLAPDEIAFYTKCSTVKGVLELHNEMITKAQSLSSGKYDLFPIYSFSSTQVKDIEDRHAELRRERERQIQQINYVVNTRNTNNPYLDPEQVGTFHSHVMQHSRATKSNKGRNSNGISKLGICHVLECGAEGANACRSKQCLDLARRYCDLHYKPGGHAKHADKDLKPQVTAAATIATTMAIATPTTTTSVTIASTTSTAAAAPTTTTNSTTNTTIISSSLILPSNTCMVLECDEIRTKMCTVCKLWTCELHGAASHVSHASQLLKHDAIVECEAENDEDNADIEDIDDNADVAEKDFNDELDDEVAEDNGVHFSRPLAKSIKRTRRK